MTKHIRKTARAGLPCACDPWCGQYVQQPPGSGRPGKWVDGHKPGRKNETAGRLCECGCGNPTIRVTGRGRWPKYLEGHDAKG